MKDERLDEEVHMQHTSVRERVKWKRTTLCKTYEMLHTGIPQALRVVRIIWACFDDGCDVMLGEILLGVKRRRR